MKLEKGFITTINSGWNRGLDIPAGEIKILAVETMAQNKNLKNDMERFIQPLMLSENEIAAGGITYIKKSFDYILEIKQGNWITFEYIEKRPYEITIPEIEFLKLLDEQVLDDLIDSL